MNIADLFTYIIHHVTVTYQRSGADHVWGGTPLILRRPQARETGGLNVREPCVPNGDCPTGSRSPNSGCPVDFCAARNVVVSGSRRAEGPPCKPPYGDIPDRELSFSGFGSRAHRSEPTRPDENEVLDQGCRGAAAWTVGNYRRATTFGASGP